LIEPANDNAKYFYLTLKQLDPGNAALSFGSAGAWNAFWRVKRGRAR